MNKIYNKVGFEVENKLRGKLRKRVISNELSKYFGVSDNLTHTNQFPFDLTRNYRNFADYA